MVNAWLQNLSQSTLNLVFPLECAGCGEEGTVLCPECVSGLPRLEPHFCPLCADPVRAILDSTGRVPGALPPGRLSTGSGRPFCWKTRCGS